MKWLSAIALLAVPTALFATDELSPIQEALLRFDQAWLGKVKPGANRYFYSCPQLTAQCRTKAYLVPGDLVVIEATRGKAVDAQYLAANGKATSGWLDATALLRQPRVKPVPTAWAGAWERVEADIRITIPAKGGYRVSGYATYGAHDPDRIKRGAINSGEIDDVAKSFKDMLLIDPPEYGCSVQFRLMGPYMLVWDNSQCGGMNVSFQGLYRRATPKRKA